MAWMSDEAFELKQENRDKKVTAQSARNRRGHTGKGGSVKLPSDHLTKKQLEAMNGECKTYRMGAPMKWGEFMGMPEDLQIMYVKALRKTYNVPNKALAEMFGVSDSLISRYFKSVGLTKAKGAKNNWNNAEKEVFYAWIEKRGEKNFRLSDKDAEAQKCLENAIKQMGEAAAKMGVDIMSANESVCKHVSTDYQITLEGKANDVLLVLKNILENRNVRLYAEWQDLDDVSE